ncbi:hypothetical protein O181_056863 [Austropuccinia psidii MF-1]|uniref:Reverse transcriptase domain-containing protein n=1 Tax=Austropuccinia psidii MF-1 TaxID=1389203 RepID=A0A9Q3HTW3_9BASI|nr:hypothetical protein [Austropuccinia psidii MF-1]
MDLTPLSFHASPEEKWDEEEEPEEIETVFKVVPPAYHQYLDVCFKLKAEKLPPHYACDHHIESEGLLPPLSFLLRKRMDGGLCLCLKYQKLNAVTRKNRYPVPPMNQLPTILNSSTIFSKIYLHGAYNLLRIKEGDEHLTAFRSKYGSYEYLVMAFGLTNAQASFQNLVNDIFADLMDIFVVVYLDDIMVFSSSEEEYFKYVASVLQKLRDNNLFTKAFKCLFYASSVEYLGYVVSGDGLKMYSSKVQQNINWPQPKKSKIFNPSLALSISIVVSLKITAITSIIKKDSPFIFNEEALSASLPNIVETDASDYALGAVLSQLNDSGKNIIAFDGFKPLPAELNYEVHEKELLGIVWALKHWRAFLLSLYNPFEGLKDHSSLQYFMSSKVLTHNQAHWAEFISEFHFTINYRSGRLATLPDALSCPENVCPERGVDFINYHQNDWNTWLPLAEFSYNNAEHSSTKQSTFFTIHGRNPSFYSIHISQDSPSGKLSTKLQSVQQVVKEELESAIRIFKKYADRNRSIPPDFQPGDKVWLASKNIKTTRPSKKLS